MWKLWTILLLVQFECVCIPISTITLVQSLNSTFFPPNIGAEPGRAKEESRITCMRMLRTKQSKITRSQPYYAARVNVSRNAFYSWRSSRALNKNKIFFLTLILWKKRNRNVIYRGLYSYRQRVSADNSFPKHFFVSFLHVEPDAYK